MSRYLFLFASLLEFTLVHYFTKTGYGDVSIESEETLKRLGSINKARRNSVEANRFALLNDLNNRATRHSNYAKSQSLGYFLSAFWKCMTNDLEYKRHIQKRAHTKGINSVSKCDKLSRIFFPVSFLILNLFYWYIYYLSN